MPLRVICPNGCVLRITDKYAGKKVRCPKCKSVIQVDNLTAKDNDLQQPQIATGSASAADQDWTDFEIVMDETQAPDRSRTATEPIAVTSTSSSSFQIDPATNLDQYQGRIERARQDRVLLSRIAAAFIFLVGLINLLPACFQWYLWSQDPLSETLPLWITLLVFLGAIHLLYALFVFQIPDWSALRAVSVVMLIEAAICGFVSVGILLGGVNSPSVSYLGLNYAMLNSASVWCVTMLLLAVVTSFLTAKESFNWQQIDRLLNQTSETDTGMAANES